ncbi:hypothetical protein L2K70_01990 [Nocardioides KLBMP 9356]|uniref:Uncharacterized protein n=1 Tax=Nocardioides potassii TaxID=2911371 RepID=A0ABS9H533_9ACTN|nr:hypothetical protein [Nocardioides potassii]MCF6376367.1 hypothetical protein [Nocardioides potassii]
MTEYQRIFVVGDRAAADEVAHLRSSLGRSVVVLTAPTAEAKRVVTGLQVEPVADVLLAPVRFPGVDRGHRLDELVRQHAVADRFRDVVVVADAATVTLLLRTLAPDQLPMAGAVTEVLLPRGSRPVPLLQAAIGGGVLALVAVIGSGVVPIWVLPLLVLLAGLVLLLVPGRRHLGEALLISVAVAVAVSLLSIAGSSRFPGSW